MCEIKTDNSKKILTLQETMDYIESLQKYGSVPGLENTKNLCEKLENPQNDLSFVHIAGTNGKGSVLAFVSSILTEAGYRVGCYSSPTIFDYRERIQINGRMISKKALCQEMTIIKEVCQELTAQGKPHPTVFEIETAAAFHYFKNNSCDIVVLETGLGGAEDATNVIQNPLIAVLTSISLDHMGILGDTIEEIAEHKAGIIKQGCQVIAVRQQPGVMEMLKEKSERDQASLKVVDSEQADCVRSTIEKQVFSYGNLKKLMITMPGRYQIGNAVLAVEVIKGLEEKGFSVKEAALRKGLAEAKWPGRFQVLAKKPLFIADGAHNRDGAARLAESIRFYFTNKRIIYIIGILRDKEKEEIIKATYPYAEQILTVPTPGERGVSAYDLACEIRKYHAGVTAVDSVEEAVELSCLSADQDTVIIAFGSLSYLGKLISAVENRDKIRRDSHGK